MSVRDSSQSDPVSEAAARRRLFALQRPGESDAAFARRLGLSPQVLSNYKNGHHGLSLRTCLEIHRNTGISLEWVLTGRGVPDLDPEEEPRAGPSSPSAEELREVHGHLVRAVEGLTRLLARAGAPDQGELAGLRTALLRYLEEGQEEV